MDRHPRLQQNTNGLSERSVGWTAAWKGDWTTLLGAMAFSILKKLCWGVLAEGKVLNPQRGDNTLCRTQMHSPPLHVLAPALVMRHSPPVPHDLWATLGFPSMDKSSAPLVQAPSPQCLTIFWQPGSVGSWPPLCSGQLASASCPEQTPRGRGQRKLSGTLVLVDL